jgi:hypothetical protein
VLGTSPFWGTKCDHDCAVRDGPAGEDLARTHVHRLATAFARMDLARMEGGREESTVLGPGESRLASCVRCQSGRSDPVTSQSRKSGGRSRRRERAAHGFSRCRSRSCSPASLKRSSETDGRLIIDAIAANFLAPSRFVSIRPGCGRPICRLQDAVSHGFMAVLDRGTASTDINLHAYVQEVVQPSPGPVLAWISGSARGALVGGVEIGPKDATDPSSRTLFSQMGSNWAARLAGLIEQSNSALPG